VQKQITLTTTGPGLVQRSAQVTLYRTTTWWAKAVVEHGDGSASSHFTLGHLDEHAALLAITEWVQGCTNPGASAPRCIRPARPVAAVGLDKRADNWIRRVFR
jgi:hypothetical protein